MSTVRRSRGIRRIIRRIGGSEQKYVTAGDRACGDMIRRARPRRYRNSGPTDSAIMAWARFDLAREILGGFWERQPVRQGC